MKTRHLLILAVLFWSSFSHAQHCDSIIFHLAGKYYMAPEYCIQVNDGSLLCRAIVDSLVPNQTFPPIKPYGAMYYKISRRGCQFIDSLFVETTNQNPRLFAALHPIGTPVGTFMPQYSNVEVEYVFDHANCQTNLRLAFFDDDLNFATNDIIVPLADTLIETNDYQSCFLLDSHNDVITEYSIPSRKESHFARFGLDGTLKYEKVYHDSIVPIYNYINYGWEPSGLRQSGESPLRYSFYGTPYMEAFKGFELDSLFNIVNTYYIPRPNMFSYPRMFSPTGHSGMVSYGDEGAVMMMEYEESANTSPHIGVAKYDADGNLLKTWFSSVTEPRLAASEEKNLYAGSDMKRDEYGNIYFSAFPIWELSYRNICYFIKLDSDLNVIYERYYVHPKLVLEPRGIEILDEGGACVYGDMILPAADLLSGLFMLVFDDDGVGMDETEIQVYPYCLYPNPVSDVLNIHYSPDVAPRQAALYDLQGRLLHTQSNDLENVHMGQLPAGTYTLHITMEDGKVYSDRVVKQ